MRKHSRMSLKVVCISAIIFCFVSPPAESGGVLNGNFAQRGKRMKAETVSKFRAKGLTCPDAKEWPDWWGCYPSCVSKGQVVEFPPTGGRSGDGYARLSGNCLLVGYNNLKLVDNFIYTVWVRGQGAAVLSGTSYGKTGQINEKTGAVRATSIKPDTKTWVRYRRLCVKTPELCSFHPWIQVREGTVDFDNVDIALSNPALDLIVQEEEKLYGTGALIENTDAVKIDATFSKRRAEYESALKDFRGNSSKIDQELVAGMEKEIVALKPYVLKKDRAEVQASYYNEMIAMTAVLKRLAKGETLNRVANWRPGVRYARRGKVTIGSIQPNRRIYDENDDAIIRTTIVNKTGMEKKGTLVAIAHLDLDTGREVKREPFTIGAGKTEIWKFACNVGPETYGRGIEVRFLDEAGNLIDSWQEYFHVASEWLRVQIQSGRYSSMSTYTVQTEPSNFSVHTTDAEIYKSADGKWRITTQSHRRGIDRIHKQGMKMTFYQNNSFAGIMGYEAMRKHPEHVMYDENGQFAIDKVYGGYPNPMELASPMEIGPKRKVKKPYLDREPTSWQHCAANLARQRTVEYGAKCVKKYAEEMGFDGVYCDELLGVTRGYGYDGKMNVPDDKKEMARRNASVRRIYLGTLKKDDPNFGTWFNFAYRYIDYSRRQGRTDVIGSGVGDDVSDEAARVLGELKNVTCLMEQQHSLMRGDGFDRFPEKFISALLENRDYIVQKYGANAITGYIHIPVYEKPGRSKWGWATINWFMAQIIASQHHIVPYSCPSLDPASQFMTRYSRFLWARDIKTVPVDEVEKTVELTTPETLWWKRLVYKRQTKGGYDLIVHLVRKPPTEKWDINWIDEPPPLAGVKLTTDIGTGQLETAQACRPYHFEEEQQPVQQVLKAKIKGGKVLVEIPPFRYNTMVVFRVRASRP